MSPAVFRLSRHWRFAQIHLSMSDTFHDVNVDITKVIDSGSVIEVEQSLV